MSATREGIKKLIFPKANQKDIAELPDYIKDGIEFHFVDEYPEVFKILFPQIEVKVDTDKEPDLKEINMEIKQELNK